MENLFKDAMQAINRSIIEYFFSGGEWRDSEYWIVSPLRDDDAHNTNFSISQDGLYYDLATGEKGNLITLLASTRGINRYDAAKEILAASGSYQQTTNHYTRHEPKDKSLHIEDFYLPIPSEKLELFQKKLRNSIEWYCLKNDCTDIARYPYYDAHGALMCVLLRLQGNKDGKKTLRPIAFKKDDKIIWKNPLAMHRPLYHLPQIIQHPHLPVLLVEGEKCADITVAGYVVSTWMGGVNAIGKTDFSILKQRNVIIWCDHDDVGYKAGEKIKEILPHAQVLRKATNKPEGWDLADAVAEDAHFDVHAYISEHLRQPEPTHIARPMNYDDPNFTPLGYIDNEWVFYLKKTKRLFYLKNTGITGQHLLQLEDLAWWENHGFISERGSFRLTHAIDYLKNIVEKEGIFDYPMNMGVGFYRQEETLLWHAGSHIFDDQGKRHALDTFLPKTIFIAEKSKNHPFYTYSEKNISQSHNYIIKEYFYARKWAFDLHHFSAKIALGWALWSPFCGFFSWRPHLHLTAAAGTGKSTFIDYCISPLVAPYALRYNNLTTSSAIRQAVNKKPRPVILEEFEANGKEGDRSNANIEAIYDLAKAASDDVSSRTMKGTPNVDSNGRQAPREFEMKISFMFVSIREAVQDAALSQRIINIELAKSPNLDHKYLDLENEAIKALKEESSTILTHNFKNLNYLIKESKALTQAFIALKMEHRQAQNYAPLLTFSHFFEHGMTYSVVEDAPFYHDIITQFHQHLSAEKQMTDAEKCLDKILQADVLGHNNERKSVTILIQEMIAQIEMGITYEKQTTYQELASHLGRMGLALITKNIKNIRDDYDHVQLAIHINNDAIRAILRNSSYASSYASILKRHTHCTQPLWRSQSHAVKYVAGFKPAFLLIQLAKILPLSNGEDSDG